MRVIFLVKQIVVKFLIFIFYWTFKFAKIGLNAGNTTLNLENFQTFQNKTCKTCTNYLKLSGIAGGDLKSVFCLFTMLQSRAIKKKLSYDL